jgi:mRNA interferase RelE/StbE
MLEWEIVFLATALADARRLDERDRSFVERAIETKLKRDPDKFGKPLRYTLRNYRVFRAGDWRVIFRLKENLLLVISIRHRREGYGDPRIK